MIEELGVKPDIGRLFYINTFIEGNDQYIEFFFEIKNSVNYLNTEQLNCSHAHEISEIIWASPTDDVNIFPKSLADDLKAGKIISDEVRYIRD